MRTKTFVPRRAGCCSGQLAWLAARRLPQRTEPACTPTPTYVSLDAEMFMAADILTLAEAWLWPDHHVDLVHGMLQAVRCGMARTALV